MLYCISGSSCFSLYVVDSLAPLLFVPYDPPSPALHNSSQQRPPPHSVDHTQQLKHVSGPSFPGARLAGQPFQELPVAHNTVRFAQGSALAAFPNSPKTNVLRPRFATFPFPFSFPNPSSPPLFPFFFLDGVDDPLPKVQKQERLKLRRHSNALHYKLRHLHTSLFSAPVHYWKPCWEGRRSRKARTHARQVVKQIAARLARLPEQPKAIHR